jgi:hypothetical protein
MDNVGGAIVLVTEICVAGRCAVRSMQITYAIPPGTGTGGIRDNVGVAVIARQSSALGERDRLDPNCVPKLGRCSPASGLLSND